MEITSTHNVDSFPIMKFNSLLYLEEKLPYANKQNWTMLPKICQGMMEKNEGHKYPCPPCYLQATSIIIKVIKAWSVTYRCLPRPCIVHPWGTRQQPLAGLSSQGQASCRSQLQVAGSWSPVRKISRVQGSHGQQNKKTTHCRVYINMAKKTSCHSVQKVWKYRIYSCKAHTFFFWIFTMCRPYTRQAYG